MKWWTIPATVAAVRPTVMPFLVSDAIPVGRVLSSLVSLSLVKKSKVRAALPNSRRLYADPFCF